MGLGTVIKKLVYLYALVHLVLSALGLIFLGGLFFLSLGTDGAAMLGIGAAAMFLNVLFFAALAYAIKN